MPIECTSTSTPTSTRGCTTAKATSPPCVHDWEVLSGVLNRVNHAMGKEALYPFRLTLPVVAKLGFVHHVLITAYSQQGGRVRRWMRRVARSQNVMHM